MTLQDQLGWPNWYTSIYLVSILLIATSFLILGVAFGVIRRRHDPSIFWMFRLLGFSLILCALSRLSSCIVFFFPIWNYIIILNYITGITSVSASILTLYYIPRILKIPSVKRLYDLNLKLREEFTLMQKRLADLPVDVHEKVLDKTIEVVKEISDDVSRGGNL